jgi:hypothetical protein
MLKTIILWSNGMVSVFDTKGAQIGDYQGRHSLVKRKLISDGVELSSVDFYIGVFGQDMLPMTREQFFSEGWE